MKPTKRWTEKRALYITNELKKKYKCSCSIDAETWSYNISGSRSTETKYILYVAKSYNPNHKRETWAKIEELFAELMTYTEDKATCG